MAQPETAPSQRPGVTPVTGGSSGLDPRTLRHDPLLPHPKAAPMPYVPDEPRDGPDWQFYAPNERFAYLAAWDNPYGHEQPGQEAANNPDMLNIPHLPKGGPNFNPGVFGVDAQLLASDQQGPAVFVPNTP